MKKISIVMACLFLFSSVSFAGGKVIGNGGDPRALEFYNSALQAIRDVKNDEALYPEVKSVDLVAFLEKAEILVSEEPLFSMKGGYSQPSTAINYRNPDTIVVYGLRWSAIKNNQIRQALALHEILSLAEIESTGIYTVSKRYLSALGINCLDGLCEVLPRYNCSLIKKSRTSLPEILDSFRIGDTGLEFETLDLKSGNMIATIVMNNGANQGGVSILLYQDSVTVSTTEINGAAFPALIQLKWMDTLNKESWDVVCKQD